MIGLEHYLTLAEGVGADVSDPNAIVACIERGGSPSRT